MPRQKPETPPLVQWEKTPAQVRVLDWRRRANAYGLTPRAAEERDEGESEEPYDGEPEQLIVDDDPEANGFRPRAAVMTPTWCASTCARSDGGRC
jgi:hypothetical protein